jgi:hypothetical protein
VKASLIQDPGPTALEEPRARRERGKCPPEWRSAKVLRRVISGCGCNRGVLGLGRVLQPVAGPIIPVCGANASRACKVPRVLLSFWPKCQKMTLGVIKEAVRTADDPVAECGRRCKCWRLPRIGAGTLLTFGVILILIPDPGQAGFRGTRDSHLPGMFLAVC